MQEDGYAVNENGYASAFWVKLVTEDDVDKAHSTTQVTLRSDDVVICCAAGCVCGLYAG